MRTIKEIRSHLVQSINLHGALDARTDKLTKEITEARAVYKQNKQDEKEDDKLIKQFDDDKV